MAASGTAAPSTGVRQGQVGQSNKAGTNQNHEGDALRFLFHARAQGYPEIWAAAGSPNAVFALTPADLVRLTGADFVEVAK